LRAEKLETRKMLAVGIADSLASSAPIKMGKTFLPPELVLRSFSYYGFN
jgi:hypothetical protein